MRKPKHDRKKGRQGRYRPEHAVTHQSFEMKQGCMLTGSLS
ncbi:hypothetical protein HMPREF3038_00680 [Akkermansia sp. KLE1797]|nr:hypothetical protein HMPREF3038_00680 [Akkermansia sp. KLE1797]KXU54236.1 hypothetical protein HMPREF3039_01564 [Akkermansia sp. KLE1798]KZA04590.1 hypothetical protein HMPREF1326_01644 [Akkermansia sp. KLE1605]